VRWPGPSRVARARQSRSHRCAELARTVVDAARLCATSSPRQAHTRRRYARFALPTTSALTHQCTLCNVAVVCHFVSILTPWFAVGCLRSPRRRTTSGRDLASTAATPLRCPAGFPAPSGRPREEFPQLDNQTWASRAVDAPTATKTVVGWPRPIAGSDGAAQYGRPTARLFVRAPNRPGSGGRRDPRTEGEAF
jgi:hypothetical protein